jgi:hypothetical protein
VGWSWAWSFPTLYLTGFPRSRVSFLFFGNIAASLLGRSYCVSLLVPNLMALIRALLDSWYKWRYLVLHWQLIPQQIFVHVTIHVLVVDGCTYLILCVPCVPQYARAVWTWLNFAELIFRHVHCTLIFTTHHGVLVFNPEQQTQCCQKMMNYTASQLFSAVGSCVIWNIK